MKIENERMERSLTFSGETKNGRQDLTVFWERKNTGESLISWERDGNEDEEAFSGLYCTDKVIYFGVHRICLPEISSLAGSSIKKIEETETSVRIRFNNKKGLSILVSFDDPRKIIVGDDMGMLFFNRNRLEDLAWWVF